MYEIITNKLLIKIQDLDDSFLKLHCSIHSDKVVVLTSKGYVKVYFLEDVVSHEDFSEFDCSPKVIEKGSDVEETIAEDILKGDGNNRVRMIVGGGSKLLFNLKKGSGTYFKVASEYFFPSNNLIFQLFESGQTS